jgi:putative MATE family efflux protein
LALAQRTLALPRRVERDLTTGSLVSLIASQSAPSVAEMALMNTVGLVQAFWMGHVSETALAAVAIGTTLRIVLISPMMGLSAGGMALVAHHIGAKERRKADHAVMQTILLVFLFIAPIMVVAQSMAPVFLRWMGTSGELQANALAYVRIVFGGLLFMEMLPTMNGVIRGAGHPEYTLGANMVHIVVMFAVGTALVLGTGPFPALGVSGAAWAAVTGSAAGVAAQLIILIGGRAGVRLHLRDAVPDWSTMKRILRIAVPSAAQRFSPNLANALLVRIVTGFGPEVLTAYSLVSRISAFLSCPGMGISTAAAAMVGQNLGARKPDRAGRSVFLSGVGAAGASLLLFGVLNLSPRFWLGFFGTSPTVMAVAVIAARFLLLSGTATSLSSVLDRSLVAAGDALMVMAISIASLWIGQVGLVWLLSTPLGLGPMGIWAGIGLGYLISCLGMAYRFQQGRWREARV